MKLSALSLYLAARHFMPGEALGQGIPSMQMGTDPGQAAHEAMTGKMASAPHMRMTTLRAMTATDSVRAMAVADTVRRALSKYADPAVAERDGYKLFAPQIKNPKVYHYTNWKHALGEAFRFNPEKPTSILYTKNRAGRMQLLGAMYTMPQRSSPADLDQRVPLSVTQWHLHTNLCAPKKGDERRWSDVQNGQALFGLAGTITTKSACDAENGKFSEVLFGWMVHANVFQGTDLKTVWGHDDMESHARPHSGG